MSSKKKSPKRRKTASSPSVAPSPSSSDLQVAVDAPKGTHVSTYLVHGESISRAWDFKHHTVPPMSASVTYRLDSSERGACGFVDFASAAAHKQEPIFIYDRLDEPTRSMLESRLAKIEAGDICVTFATGMAAISAALGICIEAGDHVISHRPIYGCSYNLMNLWLKRFGIEVDFIDLNDEKTLLAKLKPNTKVIYAETPVNPVLELVDIGRLKEIKDAFNKKHNSKKNARPLRIIVDNTFATPFGQRPLALGADMVCHSLTKNVAGFGTDMGGAVITSADLEGQLLVWRKDFGGALSSRSAWYILVYGLPTLPLRMRQQTATAQKVAEWLESRPEISRVVYPGLESFPQKEIAKKQLRTPEGEFLAGSMIYFETREKTQTSYVNSGKLINYIAKNGYSITLAVSLGQLRTLIENPGSMTHSALTADRAADSGVPPNGIRLSIGIEDAADIIRDLESALKRLKN